MNFVKIEISQMWIMWKMRFQKGEFCENWGFRNVNFVKIKILEMSILWKMRFQKGEFCENWECEFLDQIWIFTPAWKVDPDFWFGALSKRFERFSLHKRNVFHIYGEAGVVIYENKEWGNTKNFLLSTTSLSQFLERKR